MNRAYRKMVKEYHNDIGDGSIKILKQINDKINSPYFLVQVGDSLIIDGLDTDSHGEEYVCELMTYSMEEYEDICNYILNVVDIEQWSIFDYHQYLEDTGQANYA